MKKPEELASYVSSRCESWTERVAAGKAGSNDPDIVSEFQAIVDKHVSTLKKDGYVKFHRALTKEVCQTLVYQMAEGRLRLLDQQLASIELSIATHIQKDALVEIMIQKECLSEDETTERIRKMHQDTKTDLRKLYTDLRNLERERDVYLSQPMWKKYKGSPVVKKRQPFIDKTALLKYIS